ncbi:DUF2993 domain-containing protein [Nocardioides sp.]|uniref:LmeA family phospholipid-binding protein n=1 Tax=Nocardioides sp. TaxID=35761 RepID=UPI002B270C8A|nr:DUF2993 domain-containing protein [Nocardioides sp.]
MKKLVVTLAVLALIALGLDRGGVLVAERIAGDSLQESQGLSERPEVSIDGFPFLDQLVAGRYDRVEVVLREVPLTGDAGVSGAAALRLARLDVTLRRVETSRDFTRIDVGRARADALISLADLGDALGLRLAVDGDGRLTASRTFTVLGEEVTPSITIEPVIVDGALSLSEFTVNGAVDPTGALASALDEILGISVPLTGIPFDVRLEGLRVAADGLHLSLSGSDLSYVSPG